MIPKRSGYNLAYSIGICSNVDMRKLFSLNGLFLAMILSVALANLKARAMSEEEHSLALGFALGTPTGLSGRYLLDGRDSLSSVLGWTDHHINMHVDYIRMREDLFKIDKAPIDAYYGGGVILWQKEDKGDVENRLGVRIPGGLMLQIEDPNLEFFIELAVVLNLVPSTIATANFNIGLRYQFF
ncbi:MAG: hypothetical protein KDD61_18290 [Bdellovibrionales bacterium]|nr:hypothetical protein [Bdellovibrionales bacterium]